MSGLEMLFTSQVDLTGIAQMYQIEQNSHRYVRDESSIVSACAFVLSM